MEVINPIFDIVKSGNCEDLEKFLLEKVWHHDCVDEYGDTPLLIAIRNDNLDLMKELLSAGSDPYHMNKKGENAFCIAQKSWDVRVRLMIMDFDDNKDDEFMTAVLRGDKAKVNKMISDGYDINAIDEDGNTLLLSAVGRNREYATKMLLECGCDVNCVGEMGNTPFMLAMDRENKCIITMLYESGCDMRIKSKNGNDALMIAKFLNYDWGISFLESKGIC